MISVRIQWSGSCWFDVAHHGGRFVAAATGEDRKAAAAAGRTSLPRDCVFQAAKEGSEYVRGVVRLRVETRGFVEEKVIGPAGSLRVYPVERVIAKTAREGLDAGVQLSLG